MILKGCTLHRRGSNAWVGLPGKPYKDASGAETWSPIVDFLDRAAKDRFQTVALAAIAEHFPEISNAADPDRGE